MLRLITATILATTLAYPVVAQTDTQSGDPLTTEKTGRVGVSGVGSDTGSLPPDWDGEIGDALFSDTGTGTLRPETEFRANFSGLSAEQQAAVRTHCNAGGSPSTSQAEGQESAPEVTQGPLIRLCEWVGSM